MLPMLLKDQTKPNIKHSVFSVLLFLIKVLNANLWFLFLPGDALQNRAVKIKAVSVCLSVCVWAPLSLCPLKHTLFTTFIHNCYIHTLGIRHLLAFLLEKNHNYVGPSALRVRKFFNFFDL